LCAKQLGRDGALRRPVTAISRDITSADGALRRPANDSTCRRPSDSEYWDMKVKVLVTPKAAVLDPQGAAVRDAMQHLGMPEVSAVRIGKYLEIEVDDQTPNLDSRLNDLCRDLLSNPVIEDYEVVK
jgi:phosphoribosylformylglycinamidine synthase subunit PurS